MTGVVLDANGESIIGANVVVKGTNNGTITDLDGKFSIELSDGETLQVSFIGYNSKDVMVGAGENHYNHILFCFVHGQNYFSALPSCFL